MNVTKTIIGFIILTIILCLGTIFVYAQETTEPLIQPILEPVLDTKTPLEKLKEAAEQEDILTIINIQNTFFQEDSKYKQIKGLINVSESPQGWGYQTVEKINGYLIYTGYGENSKNNTYSIDAEFALANSSIVGGIN